MAYITKSNFDKIIRQTDIMNAEMEYSTHDIYVKPITFFSKLEEKMLLATKILMQDGDRFVSEVYKPLPIGEEDRLKYVYEVSGGPAYHNNPGCPHLNSDFKNFLVPQELRERARRIGGYEKEWRVVQEFRNWFDDHRKLFESDLKEFLKKLDIRFNINIAPRRIELMNSGVVEIENMSLPELETAINKVLADAEEYFHANTDKQELIRNFAKLSFLGFSKKPILKRHDGYSTEEVKTFLRFYHNRFKRPVENMLRHYYRVKFNPELEFDGTLLGQLNFRQCGVCGYAHVQQLRA